MYLSFSCNPIGRHCLGGPGYSSHTVKQLVKKDTFTCSDVADSATIILWQREVPYCAESIPVSL